MSESLTDVYDQISAQDAVYLEKHAEQIKVAEEEDAAGRIMARGFADELHKLSMPMGKGSYGAGDGGYGTTGGGSGGAPPTTPKLPKPPPTPAGGTIKTKPGFDMGGGGKTGPGGTGPVTKRPAPKGPKVPNIGNAPAGRFGKGKTVTPGGEIK